MFINVKNLKNINVDILRKCIDLPILLFHIILIIRNIDYNLFMNIQYRLLLVSIIYYFSTFVFLLNIYMYGYNLSYSIYRFKFLS